MAKGQVLRVIINGEGYDLFGAFTTASMSDWKALIAETGRGSSAVKRGLDNFGALDDFDTMTGESEALLIDTITDLIFLARRVAGERPLRYDAVADALPYFTALQALGEAARVMSEDAAEDEAADPT